MTTAIRPERIKAFAPERGVSFCLVTNSSLLPEFAIEGNGLYERYETFAYDSFGSFSELLERRLPQRAHVLVISPSCLFESPTPAELGATRKLIAFPCNSTAVGIDAVHHFLKAIEDADVEGQAARTARFFDAVEAAASLQILNSRFGTEAKLDYSNGNYQWNEQVGVLDWGQQQIAPAGELSVMPGDVMSFVPELKLAMNGEIVLHGEPIVHAGNASFSPADRTRIFTDFSVLRSDAVVASVVGGVVQAFRPTTERARTASRILEYMCEIDSRYRTVWELGFGINSQFELWPQNCGMNEVYGGADGVVHFGLGLTPYTQYALTFLSPESRAVTSNGEVIIGPGRSIVRRRRSGACGCDASSDAAKARAQAGR